MHKYLREAQGATELIFPLKSVASFLVVRDRFRHFEESRSPTLVPSFATGWAMGQS